MYGVLIVAAILFALQFLFNQQFRRLNGDGIDSTVAFATYTAGISFVVMLILNGFCLKITWFSFLVAMIYSIVSVSCTYSGLKAFATANLSVYSIFAMLGGMLLPFTFGVVFCNEEFNLAKAGCIVLIAIATILSYEKGEEKRNAYKYYIAVFVLNGLGGVLSKIHQTNSTLAVDSRSFMATLSAITFVICLLYQLVNKRKIMAVTVKEFANLFGYAFCNSIGNLFCLIALMTLPASVQYPIITGGVMLFSTVLSLIRKEKLSGRIVASTVLAFLSTILIMF